MMSMGLKLLPHAQHINFSPYLCNLVMGNTEDIHAGDFYPLTCRCNTVILALVGSLSGPTSDNLVMFGNPVVNGLLVIWEGIQHHGYHVLEFLKILAVIRALDCEPFKIGSQKFIQDGHISPIGDFVVETTNKSLVRFG